MQPIRYGGLRTLAAIIDSGDPGPMASIAKMLWSEHHRRFGELALDVLEHVGDPVVLVVGRVGADEGEAHGGVPVGADALLTQPGDRYTPTRWQADFFGSRSSTIWGGTAEIQRNIIGERVLGLPREPAPG